MSNPFRYRNSGRPFAFWSEFWTKNKTDAGRRPFCRDRRVRQTPLRKMHNYVNALWPIFATQGAHPATSRQPTISWLRAYINRLIAAAANPADPEFRSPVQTIDCQRLEIRHRVLHSSGRCPRSPGAPLSRRRIIGPPRPLAIGKECGRSLPAFGRRSVCLCLPSQPSNSIDDLPLDLTVEEVARVRRESPSQVYKKIRNGTYEAHKNGDTRLITRESVLADRDRALKAGPQLGATNRGRPPKKNAAAATHPALETEPTSSHKRKRLSAPAAE